MSAELPSNEKIIGIPKSKYIKFTYLALILSSALGIVSTLLIILIGLGILSSVAGLLGLAGVVLALLGFFAFNSKFTQEELSHFKYMAVLYVIFFVVGIVVGAVLGDLGLVTTLIIILVNVASLICMYAGYRLNEKNVAASKQTVIGELKSLKP